MKILTAILLVLVSSVAYGLEKEDQSGWSFFFEPSAEAISAEATATMAITHLVMGPVEINLETGEVEIEEGVSLSGAAAAFWEAVENHFKENAMVTIRLRLYQEIAEYEFALRNKGGTQ